MTNVWRDQDGNIVPGIDCDVTRALASGYALLGGDGKLLPPDSAPVYLEFDLGDGKKLKVLNAGTKAND